MPPPALRTLADLTTLRLGGPARQLVDAASEDALVAAVVAADDASEPLLLLGGGSNLVIADAGFPGTVVRILTRGIDPEPDGATVELTVAAGEPWDDLVARCVSDGLSGIECLSGIPGLTGATPIQNVGAYGCEVADVITGVRTWDRHERAICELAPAQCGFGYRTSSFKGAHRHVVLAVRMRLERSAMSAPIRYAELARVLGVDPGERAPLAEVRDAVLGLRRGKGMVLDPDDPDSVSAGSFFTNPILDADQLASLRAAVAARLGAGVEVPAWAEANGRTKTSAAWLIERAGFQRGYGDGRVGLSSRHTLAIINRGGATTAELVAFARSIRDGVREAYGVTLEPEPTLLGTSLDAPVPGS